MKLKDLIRSNHWLSIRYTLLDLYPDQEGHIEKYEEVLEKLRIIEPIEGGFEIILEWVDAEESLFPDDEPYVNVSGRKINDEDTQSYGLAFTEWKEWLGMKIASETLENYSEVEIIAHCLFEMTFVAFEEGIIRKHWKSILDSAEEYENMSEEEKKANTFTMEELKQKWQDWDEESEG